ncbi:hypothetical protein JTB14_007209 [Gonioctena quinquepunctata]|nr:hypothetical protein JTB14_007209 [Gonioctena quinquepunctata]
MCASIENRGDMKKIIQFELAPIYTMDNLIPDDTTKQITCTIGCNSGRCSCRKHGLNCTALCTNCNDEGEEKKCYNNAKVNIDEENEADENELLEVRAIEEKKART